MGACNPDSFRLSSGDRSRSSVHAASYHGDVSMCHQPVFAAGSGTRWVSHQTVAQFMFAPCREAETDSGKPAAVSMPELRTSCFAFLSRRSYCNSLGRIFSGLAMDTLEPRGHGERRSAAMKMTIGQALS